MSEAPARAMLNGINTHAVFLQEDQVELDSKGQPFK
jgi:hypothetical protein